MHNNIVPKYLVDFEEFDYLVLECLLNCWMVMETFLLGILYHVA